ncbi:hypothetical protein EVJ32_04835 [Exiguobacterium sp. SH5S4]|uniref:hypothetical protein n=1 Tax=Exiguobacterium sp. SH5S4 TaxID=2510961 RepID=UPI001038649D|nr:hypothetical protein [Exiguobacterium sp. SH5S4]TCI26703.1 hypothetical protein EVJ32_04835 [Exiguobacterium sp. SH5S4]
MTIYEWHIDFEGSGGLVLAKCKEDAKTKIIELYELDDFAKDHLQIKYHEKLDYKRLEKEGEVRTRFGRVQKRFSV